RLLARKAKTAGVSTDALLEREVRSQVKDPTADELKTLYDQAKASGRELPPFDDVKEEIARFIHERKEEQALDAYREKRRGEAKTENLLPPAQIPKLDVPAVGPMRGDNTAPVTIIEFSDYQCPYCGRAEPTMKKVLDSYKGKVRLVYKEFPLPIHDHAAKASEAALCANDQGKYWEMHDKLFDNQGALDVDNLKLYARDLGLDAHKFDSCLDKGEKTKDVQASVDAASTIGIHSTPAFFINGRPLSGALPY